jgi:hypothetical protein
MSITGLGTPTFDNAMKTANEIFRQFDRQFADGKLEGWAPGQYSGYSALEMSNRYFTPKRDAPSMEHVPFTKAVDPYGILEEVAKTIYIHSEESDVHYYSLEADKDGNGK